MTRNAFAFPGGLHALLAAVVSVCLAQPVWAQPDNPFPGTYVPPPSGPILITNATVLDGAGHRLDGAGVLFRDGRIAAVGTDIDAPAGTQTIDGTGRWVTPGIVDPHSHLGSAVMPYTPQELAAWDVNEIGDPVAPHLWVETTVRPQDPGFRAALAGGVTALQVLPGSANLFGGFSVVVKPVPAVTPQAMKFPDAPPGMKMACGENPKYNYAERGRSPQSRMGIVAGYEQAFASARRFLESAEREAGQRGEPKDVAVAGALSGDVRVHFHCYRSDDMAIVLDVVRANGLKVTAFHHAAEAYKITELLVENDVCGVVFSDWWGFKMENYDGIRENAAFLEAGGACVSLHSDSAYTGQRLNIEAAKAMAAGWQAGLDIPREVAIQWITLNPAKILGLDDRIGSLEPGKNADVVVWSGDPFSVYTQADLVFIDGALRFDRAEPEHAPVSDFELGQPAREGAR